jgi:hypothetical protein
MHRVRGMPRTPARDAAPADIGNGTLLQSEGAFLLTACCRHSILWAVPVYAEQFQPAG